MDQIATENLFLIEFLVDKVTIDPCFDVGSQCNTTCVTVQFLDNAPLDICEDDFCPKRKYKEESECLKSGKSCLFSLTPTQAEEALTQFDIYVDIFKRAPPKCTPDKIPLGNSLISLVNLFKELVSAISEPNKCIGTPTAKTLKDTFQITNPTGQTVGEIGMYIRMSCFGKLIVTQFQMNLEDKSVLFKDKDGHSLYRYKKVGSKGGSPPRQGGCTSSAGGRMGGEGCGGGGGYSGQRGSNGVSGCGGGSGGMYGGNDCDEGGRRSSLSKRGGCGGFGSAGGCGGGSSYGGGGYGGGMGANTGCPDVPCPPQPMRQQQAPCNECSMSGQSQDPEGCYEEIGASMGGNAIKIRVHKDNKVEEVDDDGSCACAPGKLGNRRNPLPNNQNDAPYSFKMGGCGAAAQSNVTVTPPCMVSPDGTQYTEMSDPGKDVFILRIGKKTEGSEKKSNLELELCTPKQKECPPIPKLETRDSQWDDEDAVKAGATGLGGGGKGGNGGKNGKGGKGGKGKGKK